MSDKASIDSSRSTAVVNIPGFNQLKRKHAGGLDCVSPAHTEPVKKQRLPGVAASPNPPSTAVQIPVKEGQQATLSVDPILQGPSDSAPVQNATVSPQSVLVNSQQPKAALLPVPSEQQSAEQSAVQGVYDSSRQEAMLDSSRDTTDMSALQQVIENEFNMQILMKHNELRLINQELAKCQVAMEQLRRCELRPYPGDMQPSESVSSGIGPAVAPPPGFSRPRHAAPHGVTDGPYSRHYSQWLLHDPQFDSTTLQSPTYFDVQSPVPARSTRNAASVRKSVSKPSATQGRPGDHIQSLPNYPASATREKGAPQVLKRSTDGQLVKLICNNCHRGNFSSIQGFLNHCRIAHKVDYKSHDAAAIDCGQLLDATESANVPVETHNAPSPKPTVSRATTANNTPARGHGTFVHPLNTNFAASMPINSPRRDSTFDRKPIAKLDSGASSLAASPLLASPLTPSPQLPRLSALFAKHNHGGDLAKAAAIAKQKVDLGAEDDPHSPVVELKSPGVPSKGKGSKAMGSRAGMTSSLTGNAPTPTSRKGYRQPTPAQRPRPSPLAPGPAPSLIKQESSEFLSSPQDIGSLNLSPHTADSNPGLVSDHEDDDHSDSGEEGSHEELRPPPLTVGPRNCSDNMEIDVAVEDDVGRDGVTIRRNSLLMEDRGMHGAGSPSRKLGGTRRV